MNGALTHNKEHGISPFPHGGLGSPLPALCNFSLHPSTICAAALLQISLLAEMMSTIWYFLHCQRLKD